MIELSFEAFILSTVPRMLAYHTVEQYNMKTSIVKDEKEEDSYQRHCVVVGDLSVLNLRKQFMEQLEQHSDVFNNVEMAKKSIEDNFGAPTHIIDMGNNMKILAVVTDDAVRIKMLAPTMGAIVVYLPKQMAIIKK